MFVTESEPAATNPERLPLDRLEREITQLAAHIAAATCRWLTLVAEFDRREGWLEWGCRSCAQWLSLRCGTGLRAAQEQLRVARALQEYRRVRDSFARGELSYSKVRAITRIATPNTEEELLMLARHATAAQMERVVAGCRGAASTDEANDQHERRFFDWSWEEDGSLAFRGRLSAEQGALLLKALDAGREACVAGEDPSEVAAALGEADGDAEPEPPPRPRLRRISNAEALVAVAETSLAAADACSGGADRFQVLVRCDVGGLRSGAAAKPGSCSLEHGPSLAPETLRRLVCDSSILPVAELDGKPLSVGRKTRSIPPAIRRALRLRDGGCRFPGCNCDRFTDGHHLIPWSEGGETSLDNLILLCRFHHRLLHEGGFTVEGNPAGRLRFRRPDARLVRGPASLPRGSERVLRNANRTIAPAIDSEAPVALSAGDRLDYGIAVEGLLARAGPAS